METKWKLITPEVLQKAVATEHDISPRNVLIQDIKIEDGSNAGEGFVCEIFKVTCVAVIGDNQVQKTYIAKCPPEGPKSFFVAEMDIFNQEARVYNYLVPKFQELRKVKNLKPLPFAKCFYASIEDRVIIMENLRIKDFIPVSRKIEPLNLDALKLTLRDLAVFHATGYYFLKNYPGGREALAEEYHALFGVDVFSPPLHFAEKMKVFYGISHKMNQGFIAFLKKYGTEELAERISKYNTLERLSVLFPKKSKISFFTHGDAAYRNFMYRPNDVNPEEVRLIDLQNLRYTRLGFELVFFFCTSATPQQRKDHFEDLMSMYHQVFFDELKSLGDTSEPFFTLEELKEEYDDCFPFGFTMGCGQYQAYLVREGSKADFDLGALANEETSAKMVDNLNYHLLKEADEDPVYRANVLSHIKEGAKRNII